MNNVTFSENILSYALYALYIFDIIWEIIVKVLKYALFNSTYDDFNRTFLDETSPRTIINCQ